MSGEDKADIDSATLRAWWDEGRWDRLRRVSLHDIADMDARAEFALLLAAAQFHHCDKIAVRTLVRQALAWGATRSDAFAQLFAGLENTMGRIALRMGQEEAAKHHFQGAVAPANAGAGAEHAAFVRQVHQMVDTGHLPEAVGLIADRATEVPKMREVSGEDWYKILDSQVKSLTHELSLSVQRGQLSGAQSETERDLDPAALAELHSTSQLGQDIWVLQKTGFKKDGFFVEFGATNGVLLSNTYLLETRFGWSGICAEPNPTFFSQLKQNRKCTLGMDCIAGETGRSVRFITADVFGGMEAYADDDMHSDKRRAYEKRGDVLDLTTISLNDFLEKHGAPRQIDYLSIDTEGSEYEILSNFPFEDWDIALITVEHNFTPMRVRIAELMEAKGYARTEAKWDDWYARRAR